MLIQGVEDWGEADPETEVILSPLDFQAASLSLEMSLEKQVSVLQVGEGSNKERVKWLGHEGNCEEFSMV